MSSNSSGSVDRFLLGPNETKIYETLAPGGNTLVIDVENAIGQRMDGEMVGASATLTIQTSENARSDSPTWTTVTPTLNVVAGGKAAGTYQVGRFARITNSGNGLVTVVLKPLHRIQPFTTL